MVLTLGLVVGTARLGNADMATDLNNQATTMNNLATSQGETHVTGKVADDFSSFLGSDSNAVVTGLRNGTPITLTRTTTVPSTTPGGLSTTTTTTTTVITPPTGHMGHGNVYISLALAKYKLSTMGITEPTPQQLQTALTGGTITQTSATGTTTTTMQGILTMRSQNMGWGKIAQELGTKLGPVISGMKSANHQLASAATTSSKQSGVTGASGQASDSSKSGIVSGSGKSHGNSAQGMSSGKGSGSGIVSASGKGQGNAYGAQHSSIVSGGGGAASSSGIVSARGGSSNGLTHGKGQSK
jgi:hypothetical protein